MSGDSAMWALGLMSGTSMDGVDAALIRTDGEGIAEFGPTLFQAYGDEERAVLRAALKDACGMTAREDRFGRLSEAEGVVTDAHAHAIAVLLIAAEKKGIRPEVIGFHGQTVHHAPDRGFTAQIGDANVLAERFNLPVVYDFRSADIRAGGQGAPLVPVYHRALARKAGLTPPVAFLNIGGVANVTLIGPDGELTAFDTGPGNALIDDLVFNATGARFDVDGAIAAQGHVDASVLGQLLDHPHFEAPAPKSLDRNTFRADAAARLPFADRVATLTAFTAEGIAAGLRLAGAPVRTVIVSGGGARNPVMVRMIAERAGVEVVPAGKVGFDSDFVEAQAFAYLAARRLKGLPSSFPTTTGTPVQVVCGEIS